MARWRYVRPRLGPRSSPSTVFERVLDLRDDLSATTMSHFDLPEPPTVATIAEARRSLENQQRSVRDLSDRIQVAEDSLARVIRESRYAIAEMEKERAQLEERVSLTLAYISPIKRLPNELLRAIFQFNFEEDPRCAWVLSAVCQLWRKLVLNMPIMWSKASDTSLSSITPSSQKIIRIVTSSVRRALLPNSAFPETLCIQRQSSLCIFCIQFAQYPPVILLRLLGYYHLGELSCPLFLSFSDGCDASRDEFPEH